MFCDNRMHGFGGMTSQMDALESRMMLSVSAAPFSSPIVPDEAAIVQPLKAMTAPAARTGPAGKAEGQWRVRLIAVGLASANSAKFDMPATARFDRDGKFVITPDTLRSSKAFVGRWSQRGQTATLSFDTKRMISIFNVWLADFKAKMRACVKSLSVDKATATISGNRINGKIVGHGSVVMNGRTASFSLIQTFSGSRI